MSERIGEINQGTVPAEPLSIVRKGALGLVTLARPERRNALSEAMEAALAVGLPKLARDPGVYALVIRSGLAGVFSVGGDVREIVALATRDPGAARAALGRELYLCWLLECFSKPTVSLIDGAVMGSGAGISIYGTHRVAGDGYRFSMPETAIGYFPDCGLAHAFARMPSGIGLYLGLTGAEVGPADALALGLATHALAPEAFAEVEALLADAEPVDPVLDARHRALSQGPLIDGASQIARYFDAPDVADTLARLERPAIEDRDWAAATLTALRRRSPLALCLTHRAISQAADLDIRETLAQDFRLASRLIEGPEFREGVRAMLVDKDRAPRWQHPRVEDVPGGLIDDHFAPLGADELGLPTRAEMQKARP